MASRVLITAAACVVTSGLFVGGAGAAMAFADPASGQGGEGGGTQVNDAAGTGTAPSSGAAAGETPVDTPITEAPVAAVLAEVAPKATSQVGDGRNGLASGEHGTTGGAQSASKRSEGDRKPPSQTLPAASGEPGATPTKTRLADVTVAAATPTKTSTAPTPIPPVPPLTEVTEQVAGTGASNDPDDPDDPKQRHPGLGWPWWGPCPDPDDPDDPDGPGPGLPPGSGSGGGGSGGAPAKPPSGRPNQPPAMQLPLPRVVPPELAGISVDPLVDAVAGLATAAAELPFVPITLPVIVAPLGAGGAGGGGGAGAGGPGPGPRPGTPSAPRTSGGPQNSLPPPRAGQQNPPVYSASNGTAPESFRVGYGNYLRTAGIGQMMAVAVPGVTGILVLTGVGGLLGYRQARSGHTVRANGAARFMG